MALLPLAAAALLARLPEPRRATAPGAAAASAASAAPTGLRALYVYEFAFVFATIVSFPYLIALVDQRIPGIDATVAGALFALPHLCYLLLASRVHTAFLHRPRAGLALGYLLVAAGLAGHGPAHSVLTFTLARLVLGGGLTLGLVCLSILAADAARGRAPGRMFGTLELISKGGAVAAGVIAMLVNSAFGADSPVLIGTAAALAAAAFLLPRLLWSR